jgi:hypothetical protein
MHSFVLFASGLFFFIYPSLCFIINSFLLRLTMAFWLCITLLLSLTSHAATFLDHPINVSYQSQSTFDHRNWIHYTLLLLLIVLLLGGILGCCYICCRCQPAFQFLSRATAPVPPTSPWQPPYIYTSYPFLYPTQSLNTGAPPPPSVACHRDPLSISSAPPTNQLV